MSFADPKFVEIYEQIDGDRTIDLDFYRRIASKEQGAILEAGCGSGRVLLRLLDEGYEVEGFDPSDAMLDVLRQRARQLDMGMNVWRGDFNSIQRSYSAVISPFNSLMHLLTQDEQVDAFKVVHRSLTEDGLFAFDIANPWTLDIEDEGRQFESSFIDHRTGAAIEIWRWFVHDPIEQRGEYHREFISEVDRIHSVIDFRWSYPSEIELLLRLAGFHSWEVFGGFENEPLTEESDCQVWVARK